MTVPANPWLPPLGRQLARNALAGGGARLVTLLVGLVVTSFLFRRFGPERFGVWALLSLVTGLLGLLDLSVRSAVVKQVAEAFAKGDREEGRGLLATALVGYAGLGLLVGPLAWVGCGPLLEVLRLPTHLRAEAADTFLLGAAGFLASSILGVFPAACEARQRLDLTNTLGLAVLAVAAPLTIVAVNAGLGLRGAATVQVAAVLAFHLACAGVARRLLGPLDLSCSRVSLARLRRLLEFGLTLHVSAVCVVVNRQLDKLLLTRLAGLPTVASYEVGARLVGSAGSLQPYLAAGLLPAASHLSAGGEGLRLRAVYAQATRYLLLVGLPPYVFLAASASDLLTAWLGRPDPTATVMALLLLGGSAVNALSNGMAFVCQGVGRPGLQAEQSTLQLFANVVLSLLLIRLVGPYGAPIGTSLALLLGAAHFARRFHREQGWSLAALLRESALPTIGLTAAVAAVAGLALSAGLGGEDRLGAAVRLVVAASTFSLVFLGGCLLTGQVGRQELRHLRRALLPSGGPVAG